MPQNTHVDRDIFLLVTFDSSSWSPFPVWLSPVVKVPVVGTTTEHIVDKRLVVGSETPKQTLFLYRCPLSARGDDFRCKLLKRTPAPLSARVWELQALRYKQPRENFINMARLHLIYTLILD